MISDKLRSVILKKLDLEDFPFAENTLASDVPGWDSLSHTGIIMAIEKDYRVRFTTLEILKCKCVADLQKLVDTKVPPQGA